MSEPQEINLETPIPRAWLAKLEILAKQTGRSQTELVQEALAQYFDQYFEVTAAQRSPLGQIEQFESELASLKQKVTELEPYKQQLGTFLLRLEAIERKLSHRPENPYFPPALSPAPPSQNFIDDEASDDDDFDDEPDEVLTDFLPR